MWTWTIARRGQLKVSDKRNSRGPMHRLSVFEKNAKAESLFDAWHASRTFLAPSWAECSDFRWAHHLRSECRRFLLLPVDRGEAIFVNHGWVRSFDVQLAVSKTSRQ